tara:strand:+ start:4618 stop:5226 length:609 start_codon:yes stop_codon:yes gene_type:complete
MGKKKKSKKQEQVVEEVLEEVNQEADIPYLLSLYGKVDEDECSEIVHTLYGQKLACEAGIREPKPIKLLVSTHGGDAVEMFSVYDTMKHVQKTYPIHTIGMGKIMSAGTLILAAGKKGKRKIGSNCRLMIHNVKGMPPYPDCFDVLRIEIKEIEWFQERYINCLARETHLSEDEIREVLKSNQNVYLDADEAVKCGFADKII